MRMAGVLLAIVVTVAGCGGGDDDTSSPPTTIATTTTPATTPATTTTVAAMPADLKADTLACIQAIDDAVDSVAIIRGDTSGLDICDATRTWLRDAGYTQLASDISDQVTAIKQSRTDDVNQWIGATRKALQDL